MLPTGIDSTNGTEKNEDIETPLMLKCRKDIFKTLTMWKMCAVLLFKRGIPMHSQVYQRP